MKGYRTLNDYLAGVFPGKVRKIAVNANLGCPNRDGTIGTGGCSYCCNDSFSPAYTVGSISEQIEEGKKFSASKGDVWGYLAYFQSYTGTYGAADKLIPLYEEALSCPGVVGLVIATRPDCIGAELLSYFRRRFGTDAPEAHPFLLVEVGVESTLDRTLASVNRGHTWECARSAIVSLHEAGIEVGAHLIIGLPGERMEDFLLHAQRISALPVSTLKLHQLQILRGTPLERLYAQHPEEFSLMTPETYAQVVARILKCLREDIALDRFVSESPKAMVVAPSWGLKPAEFAKLLAEVISELNS